jgi:hypothetical protein
MNDIKILGYGSMLIESPAAESEDEFRLYVTGLLAEIFGHLPDWLVFKVKCRFERQGKCFREPYYPCAPILRGSNRLRAFWPEPLSVFGSPGITAPTTVHLS